MTTNVDGAAFWLEVSRQTADLLKAWAWPVVALTIVCLFRSPLRGLISRLRRAGRGGIEFDPGEQGRHVSTISDASLAELKPVPGVRRTPAIEAIERRLRPGLQQFDEGHRLDVAMISLAAARLDTHFALTYIQIFGSQIRALRLLNQSGGSVPVDDARKYFESEVLAKYEPLSALTYDTYTSFLKRAELIEEKGDEVVITEIGRAFLVFLTHYRMREDKPL